MIDNLNNNKSPGRDNFGPTLVKEMAGLITEPLLFIYNLSFSTGVVPGKLKVAKVIPVYNKNLAIANRSRVSCAHNTSRAFIGLNITP